MTKPPKKQTASPHRDPKVAAAARPRSPGLIAQIWLPQHKASAVEQWKNDSIAEFQFAQRRFTTILGVANTAAVLACVGAFVQADDALGVARLIMPPLPFFVGGMLAAGLYPFAQGVRAIANAVLARDMEEILEAAKKTPPEKPETPTSALLLYLVGLFTEVISAVSAAILFVLGVCEAMGVINGMLAAS